MATLITGVYVLFLEEFIKLDLHSDESILMRYTTKDLQQLSKIFSPYSKDFTFPASSKNRAAFGFFGDTDVVKVNPESKFIAKIYIAGILKDTGFIQLSDIGYRKGAPTDFTGSFSTSMTNLKDRIGDDLITDLTEEGLFIDWSPANVLNLMRGAQNTAVDGVAVSYFVPLISSNRVLAYDANPDSLIKDNVAYDLYQPSNSTIETSELRPAMSFSTIIELIKNKYNLDVVAPLDLRKEYTELIIWCNSEVFFSPVSSLLTVYNPFGPIQARDTKNESGIPDPKKYNPVVNITDNSFTVTKRALPFTNSNEYTDFFNFKINLGNVLVTGSTTEAPAINVKIIESGSDQILISKNFELLEFFTGSFYLAAELQILDSYFTNDVINFYVEVELNAPMSWSNCHYEVNFKYYDGKTGFFSRKEYATYYYTSVFNYNSADVGGTRIDLFRCLPKVKVVDFLTSYFKAFNISVFDTNPNDERLYWLTPEDIQTDLLPYSKTTLDYTPYLNFKSFKKSTSGDYNYYNFKHFKSEYKSNVDYLLAKGLEYGQAVYPLVKPKDPIEFTVETTFSLMVPVLLIGTSDVITYYGFTASKPEILETGESRYEPNYGELTIFYNGGSKAIVNPLSFNNQPLNSYMKVLPFNTESKSLAFSVLKELGVEYPESLYKRFYKQQTERLLDPNVLSQEYEITLPPNEIYLNEAATIQGGGLTPKGFRLQNDIILGEDLFSILDATIDYTTGKTKITLLNY